MPASMTWGDLPEAVRQLCANLKPPVEPHEWDNMNVAEQRDWAIHQLAISERFLDTERKNHQVSINAWGEVERELEALKRRDVTPIDPFEVHP